MKNLVLFAVLFSCVDVMGLITPPSLLLMSSAQFQMISERRIQLGIHDSPKNSFGFFSIHSDAQWFSVVVALGKTNNWRIIYKSKGSAEPPLQIEETQADIPRELGDKLYALFKQKIKIAHNQAPELGVVDNIHLEFWVNPENEQGRSGIWDRKDSIIKFSDKILFIVNASTERIRQRQMKELRELLDSSHLQPTSQP